VCRTEGGGCSPTLNVLLIPAGEPRGLPKDMQTKKVYYVFANVQMPQATSLKHGHRICVLLPHESEHGLCGRR
jgi:hypothetical protein